MPRTEEQTVEFQNGISAYYRVFYTDRKALALPEDAGEWYRKGWESAALASQNLPKSTPEWIVTFLGTTPHGGWIHPIHLTEQHPLVKDAWTCQSCRRPFVEGQIGIIMPYHSQTQATWIAYHQRPCAAQMIGLDAPWEAP